MNNKIKTATVKANKVFTIEMFEALEVMAEVSLEKGQILTGIVKSAQMMLTEDTFKKDYSGKDNERYGEQIVSIRLVFGGQVDTTVNLKLGYAKDYTTPGSGQEVIKARMGRYIRGIKAQLNKELPMNSFKEFNEALVGETLTVKYESFGETVDLNGNKKPIGYMITFDVDSDKEDK